MSAHYVYILTNKSGTLYIGATSNLKRRLNEHQRKYFKNSFTARYNINKLIYYEVYANSEDAFLRERQIKGWTRIKKITLIESKNPNWIELEI